MKDKQLQELLQKVLTEAYVTVKQVEVQQGIDSTMKDTKIKVIRGFLEVLYQELEDMKQ